MKALVIGLGSMGKRRIRCLQALGVENIMGNDPRSDRCHEAMSLYGIKAGNDITIERPFFAIISTPPDTHEQWAQTCKEVGIPCFIEAGTAKLTYGTPSATMLFHPAIRLIQKKLPEIGKPSNILYHCGQYLPDWHPYEKVSDFYVATSGAREMVAFELTWITKIFGFPACSEGYAGKTMEIEGLKAPDTFNILMDYDGSYASIVIDVTSRVATRRLVVNGAEGQLIWDWNEHCIKIYKNGAWSSYSYELPVAAEGYNKNITEQMYIEEIQAFLDSLTGKAFPNTIENNNHIIAMMHHYENRYPD